MPGFFQPVFLGLQLDAWFPGSFKVKTLGVNLEVGECRVHS